MSKKRSKEGEGDEMMRLTKVAKSWEFTCSFCFKKFPSAQAVGGHQNGHRRERLEEKRLSVRDPIAYRKRAFLRGIKDKGDDEMVKIHETDNAAAAAESEDGGEKACIEFDLDRNLDLTLKL